MVDCQELVPKSASVIVKDTSMGMLKPCDWLAAVTSCFNVAVRCVTPNGNTNRQVFTHGCILCHI